MPTLIDAPMLSALVQRYPFSPQSWQGKCITITQGNRSLTGTILLAVLGQTPPGPPAFPEWHPDPTERSSFAGVRFLRWGCCALRSRFPPGTPMWQ